MSHVRTLVLVLVSSLPFSCHSVERSEPARPAAASATPVYPSARQDDVVDDYFGTPVADPYRWLEDPDAPETRTWVAAQNVLTRAWIDAVPEREVIEKRLSEVWNYERYGVPSEEAGRYFFTRNDGLQNQGVIYVADALDAAPRVLLDPNTLSPDGTISVGGTRASPGGKLFAYALSEAGSDWETIRVRDVASGKDLEDRVAWVKFSLIAWSKDAAGFYYSTFPQHDTTGQVKLEKQELRYHALGTPQTEDELVYARPDQPEWGFSGYVTADGELLVIGVSQGTDPRTQVFVKDLRTQGAPVVELITGFDAEYDPLEKLGNTLYVKTDLDAPTRRIVAIDLAQPAREHWRTVVPARPSLTLVSALVSGAKLVCAYLEDAHSRVDVFDPIAGTHAPVELGGLGTVSMLSANPRSSEAFFALSSFTSPARIMRLGVSQASLAAWRTPKVAFEPADYVTQQLFATSRDGTRVPLFVTHKKSLTPSANTPCFLYGYGGFDVSITPEFSPAMFAWMELGGVYASAVLRGGGEYGREWHDAGTQAKKQNVFDDFIACAEHLIAHGITSAPKLAIHGASNGGLLVGACMTQRPELFGAALPGVGVLDMLRYHQFTIGWAWESDYGCATKSHEAFDYLRAYSPLHNVRAGACYPATMITTADHDDRVVPAHSYKFAAALQAAQSCANPILARIDVRAGHGAGKPTAKKIEEWADTWAFVWRALGMSSASARP